MIKKTKTFYIASAAALLALAPTGCINEDLSDCGVDYTMLYRVSFDEPLLSTLRAELATPAETQLRVRLEQELDGVLATDGEHLSAAFYQGAEGGRTDGAEADMTGRDASFTFYLRPGDYAHLAVAFTDAADRSMAYTLDGTLAEARMAHAGESEPDTVDGHRAAYFVGNERLHVESMTPAQTFFVPLYMQNAATVLVADPAQSGCTVAAAYVRGVATSFALADSTYAYHAAHVVRADLSTAAGLTACHAACFPSAATAVEAAALRTRACSEDDPACIWEMDLYVRQPGGELTRNTLHVARPLLAGHMVVLKVVLDDQGQATAVSSEVGVSVTLDWKPGGDHDVEI